MDEGKKKVTADQLFEKRLKESGLGSACIGNDKVLGMLREFYAYGINDRPKLYNIKDTHMPEQYDRRRLMKHEIALMQKLRADGWTFTALASKFNVSVPTCRYWCDTQARKQAYECSKKWKQAHPLSRSEMQRRVECSLQYKQKLREEGKL